MLIRLVLSLLFVAALLIFAARVAKKRGLGGGVLVEVLGRQVLSRGGSVNVVRVADRVFMLGTTEAQITLLAELDEHVIRETLETPVEVYDEDSEGEEGRPVRMARTPRTPRPTTGVLAGSVFDRSQWATFVESLREKTVRRG